MAPELIELAKEWGPIWALVGFLLWERLRVRREHQAQWQGAHEENLACQREMVRALEAVKVALIDVRIALAREGR